MKRKNQPQPAQSSGYSSRLKKEVVATTRAFILVVVIARVSTFHVKHNMLI